jgi:hypothetical protein
VAGIERPLAGAEIDITGVDNAGGTELLYFEIFMEKYLSASEKAH